MEDLTVLYIALGVVGAWVLLNNWMSSDKLIDFKYVKTRREYLKKYWFDIVCEYVVGVLAVGIPLWLINFALIWVWFALTWIHDMIRAGWL